MSYGAPDSPAHTGHVRCASHVTKAVGIRPLEHCLLGPPGCPVARDENGRKRYLFGNQFFL
jgi:hypothetical protein